MARLRGHFEEVLQDSQEFGSTDAHMVSRVYFVLEREKEPISCYVDVGQPYGTSFEDEPVEVGFPKTLDGRELKEPWDHKEFRDLVEAYYRSFIGSGGAGISIGSGCTGIRMRKNRFGRRQDFELDVPDFLPGSW